MSGNESAALEMLAPWHLLPSAREAKRSETPNRAVPRQGFSFSVLEEQNSIQAIDASNAQHLDGLFSIMLPMTSRSPPRPAPPTPLSLPLPFPAPLPLPSFSRTPVQHESRRPLARASQTIESATPSPRSDASMDDDDEPMQLYLALEQSVASARTRSSTLPPRSRAVAAPALQAHEPCALCADNEANVAAVPCGHMYTCGPCAAKAISLAENGFVCCPFCREFVREFVRTLRP